MTLQEINFLGGFVIKKFFAALLCGAMILSSSLCLAAVDGGKIMLGGISPGITTADLIKACGQPLSKDPNGDDWQYKNQCS